MERIYKNSTVKCNVCGTVIEPVKGDYTIECDCKRVSVSRNNINYMEEKDFTETIQYEYVSQDTLREQFVEQRKHYENSMKNWISHMKEKRD